MALGILKRGGLGVVKKVPNSNRATEFLNLSWASSVVPFVKPEVAGEVPYDGIAQVVQLRSPGQSNAAVRLAPLRYHCGSRRYATIWLAPLRYQCGWRCYAAVGSGAAVAARRHHVGSDCKIIAASPRNRPRCIRVLRSCRIRAHTRVPNILPLPIIKRGRTARAVTLPLLAIAIYWAFPRSPSAGAGFDCRNGPAVALHNRFPPVYCNFRQCLNNWSSLGR